MIEIDAAIACCELSNKVTEVLAHRKSRTVITLMNSLGEYIKYSRLYILQCLITRNKKGN